MNRPGQSRKVSHHPLPEAGEDMLAEHERRRMSVIVHPAPLAPVRPRMKSVAIREGDYESVRGKNTSGQHVVLPPITLEVPEY